MNLGEEISDSVYLTIEQCFEYSEALSSTQVALQTGYPKALVEVALSDMFGEGQLTILDETTVQGHPIYTKAK